MRCLILISFFLIVSCNILKDKTYPDSYPQLNVYFDGYYSNAILVMLMLIKLKILLCI